MVALGGLLVTPADGATPSEQAGCAPDPAVPKRQLRASWVASVVNIDWPWLNYLTGAQGGDPGWDPLAFAVTEAHRRNLELHGWFNPYRLSMDTNQDALVPSHPARQHPDWVVTYGGELYYNPGIPAARRLVEDAIMDAVRRYDLDAVHFDDYFYPYPVAGQTFDDAAAYAEHGAGLSLPDWRRRNIDLLITELGQRIKKARPQVKFGISPFAVWRNAGTLPAGSATT